MRGPGNRPQEGLPLLPGRQPRRFTRHEPRRNPQPPGHLHRREQRLLHDRHQWHDHGPTCASRPRATASVVQIDDMAWTSTTLRPGTTCRDLASSTSRPPLPALDVRPTLPIRMRSRSGRSVTRPRAPHGRQDQGARLSETSGSDADNRRIVRLGRVQGEAEQPPEPDVYPDEPQLDGGVHGEKNPLLGNRPSRLPTPYPKTLVISTPARTSKAMATALGGYADQPAMAMSQTLP